MGNTVFAPIEMKIYRYNLNQNFDSDNTTICDNTKNDHIICHAIYDSDNTTICDNTKNDHIICHAIYDSDIICRKNYVLKYDKKSKLFKCIH